MRLFLTTLLLVGTAFAQPPRKGQCPPGSGGIGLCVFNPDINCTGDDGCSAKGQLCCPDGCNRSCKDAVFPDDKVDVCPPTGIQSIGPCVFDPKVNCVENSDCPSGKVCCAQGCNKVCKDPQALPRPVRPRQSPTSPPDQPPPPPLPGHPTRPSQSPTTPPDQAPPPLPSPSDQDSCPAVPPSPSLGVVCPYDPNVNCVDSSTCAYGQTCCPDKCGKTCKNNVPKPPKIPPPPQQPSTTANSCPPAGPSIGACVFNPDKSCSDDGDCKNGKVCCALGCGKECVNPDPITVHQATKP